MGRIVVGVDGSPGAVVALEWALAEARLRGATLEVVHVYAPPSYYAYSMATVAAGGEALAGPEADARRLAAEEALDEVLAKAASEWTDVEVRRSVIEALAPARVLVEGSRGADLLVVGSRGRGGFAGLLLGSVSQQCVQHATCPMVVVPPPDRSADG
ncbi:MAG: universal stress protein [Egibacteraceae bacterium]|jgi:nucleotide-binding universal stress UspA family protein